MRAAIRNVVCTGLLAAALAAGPSLAVTTADLAGTALGAAAPAERVVNVDSSTRWINVNYGDTVKFVVSSGGETRSFVFRFDGTADRVGLADISPQGMRSANVTIYIDQNQNPMRRPPSY